MRHRLPALVAVLAGACAAAGDGGFDLDVDPDQLGKADGDPCARYPGGPKDGDDLLVLVNKEPGLQLRSDWQPRDLVGLPSSLLMPGRTGELRLAAFQAFVELAEAARREANLDLGVRSAYRSFRTQCITFDHKVQQNGLAHARRFSAEPGRSQHQLGTTVDISSARLGWALTQSMGDAPEGLWLEENSLGFGFALSYPRGAEEITGYAYEPWHFRYIGREAAAELSTSGLLLEEYLDSCLAGDPLLRCPREEAPELIPNEGFIGGACEQQADCAGIGSAAFCLTESDGFAGGSCTMPCDRLCPDRPGLNTTTFCAADDATGAGLCHSRCDHGFFPATGCRPGYVCRLAERPGGDGVAEICLPR